MVEEEEENIYVCVCVCVCVSNIDPGQRYNAGIAIID